MRPKGRGPSWVESDKGPKDDSSNADSEEVLTRVVARGLLCTPSRRVRGEHQAADRVQQPYKLSTFDQMRLECHEDVWIAGGKAE